MVEVEKVNKKYINVISQYNAQCHALKTAFQREKLPNLNINTVVASQGKLQCTSVVYLFNKEN